MKTIWNASNYGNDLRLTRADVYACSHSGDCSDDVKRVLNKPYIKKQLAAIEPAQLAKELSEYGAWNETELQDHNANLERWVWISAGNISDGLC